MIKLDTHVSVLGTEYRVIITTEEEDQRLKGADGACDYYAKEILIRRNPDIWQKRPYIEKVIRHEIIHAFMFESGLSINWEHKEFGQEETVVDWFAIQMNKIIEAVTDVYASITKEENDD